MYGGQGSGSKSEFSPFTLRDQGIKLKLSGLVQVPSPAEPSHQPLNFIEKKNSIELYPQPSAFNIQGIDTDGNCVL